jgi:hypothetical protein
MLHPPFAADKSHVPALRHLFYIKGRVDVQKKGFVQFNALRLKRAAQVILRIDRKYRAFIRNKLKRIQYICAVFTDPVNVLRGGIRISARDHKAFSDKTNC